MVEIKVELKGFGRLTDDLEKFAKRAIPYAIRDTLNGSAFALQKEWRSDVKRSFTLRNRFTEQAIRVDKASGTQVSAMEAKTGTIAPYMPDQESGGTVKGKGKHKAIPTAVAAGQGQGAKRTRMVRAGLRLQAVQVEQIPQKYGKRRQNALAIAVALRKGQKHVMLNRTKGNGRAIFEVKGGTKGRKGVRVRMLWNMSRSSVHVDREPTLQRSIGASERTFEQVQYNAMITQLKRNRVVGY
jgi:hypothetical protein